MIELRLGLFRIQRRGSSSERSTPLTRTNFGIGTRYEVITEFEYSADEHNMAEGALGFKWARLEDDFGIGVETLVLLPVQSAQAGTGIESQFLTTLQRDGWQLHANAGLIYDARSKRTERGWRASLLAEFPRERVRPGIELFVKDTRSEDARVQAGIGVIKRFRHFQLRSGIHFGLSDNAPDVEVNLWFAWSWSVSRN